MMAVSERRERVAEILADGLVKLLKSKAAETPVTAPAPERVDAGEAPRLKLIHSRPVEES